MPTPNGLSVGLYVGKDSRGVGEYVGVSVSSSLGGLDGDFVLSDFVGKYVGEPVGSTGMSSTVVGLELGKAVGFEDRVGLELGAINGVGRELLDGS